MKPSRLWTILLGLALLVSGCRRAPTDDERDNRRALDAVLTAVTIKNQRLLRESAAVAKRRHDDGKLTDEEFQGIEAFVGKARAGDWSGAETDAYKFRKEHPFVKEGQ
jgi:hypothetical protein